MKKSTIHIYINNSLAFIIFYFLKVFYKKIKGNYSNSILFINTGQIGDLLVSALLLENEEFFKEFDSLFFLIKKEYMELFTDYSGRFKIISYNPILYKYFLPYKLKFLNKLRKEKFKKCFNLTAARGIINDEMAILTGAKEVYCLNSDWKCLKKLFGAKMESYYTDVLMKNTFNEYDKHAELLRKFNINGKIKYGNYHVFNIEKKKSDFVKYNSDILIAPFSSVRNRDWPIDNYKKFISLLNGKYRIILLGNKKQRSDLEKIGNNATNVKILAGELKLNEIPYLMSNTRLFIGNDSGLSHMALKLNLKMIVILGGGQYGRFLPYKFTESNKQFFLSYPLSCYGCEWNCKLKEKECITKITVKEVFDIATKILTK